MEEEVKEEVKREEGVTEGGHKYIKIDDLLVRDSVVGRRLKEDGETFDEYKVRQKMIKVYTKDALKGKHLWLGGRGTYIKKEVEAYIKHTLEQKKKELETQDKNKENG
jgi:hypothetical protein